MQLSINFSENWNFWNWDNCWNCGTHLCAEFWDKAKDDAGSEAFSARTHCSKRKCRLSSVLQCLAMNLPTFSSFQGMQNCRIWRLPYVVLLQCCSKGSIMSSMSVYLDKYFSDFMMHIWSLSAGLIGLDSRGQSGFVAQKNAFSWANVEFAKLFTFHKFHVWSGITKGTLRKNCLTVLSIIKGGEH